MKSILDINKYLDRYLIVVDGEEEKVVYDIDDSRIFSVKITGCGRGARNAVLTRSTFLTLNQAEKGIKYLDSCYWNFKFRIIKVSELKKISKKGYEILLEDIKSFNFDIDFKNETEKEEKKKHIISKGWVTLWNEDNWVNYKLMRGVDIDRCGLNLDSAYQCQIKRENELKKQIITIEELIEKYEAEIKEKEKAILNINEMILIYRNSDKSIDIEDLIEEREGVSHTKRIYLRFLSELKIIQRN